MNHIKHFSEFSESLKYHLANSMPITENVFRPGSEKFFSVLEEARNLFDEGALMLEGIDKELYETTEIGILVILKEKEFLWIFLWKSKKR